MKNKRGISTLIATVLLIAFVVILAAILISWGTDFFSNIQKDTDTQTSTALDCTKTKLEFVEIGNVDQVCFDNVTNVVRFSIKNTGSINVTALKITVMGNATINNIINQDLAYTLAAQSANTSTIAYAPATYGGTVKLVSIVPQIRVDSKNVSCTFKELTSEMLSVCS